MKRIFNVLGMVFVVLVIVAAAFIGYAAYSGSGLDSSSKAFVHTSLPAITQARSPEELLRRAAPELKRMADAHPQRLRQLFKKLSALGRLRDYEGTKGEALFSMMRPQANALPRPLRPMPNSSMDRRAPLSAWCSAMGSGST